MANIIRHLFCKMVCLVLVISSSNSVFGRHLTIDDEEASFVNDDTTSWNLTLLHVNDIHAHFEETNVEVGRCNTDEQKVGKCFGGAARLLTKVNEIKSEAPDGNTLFLNGGDYYTGTVWYEKFKYRCVIKFSNMMNYDASAIGNHDFDDGVEGLVPFIDGANFDMLAANLDHSSVPQLHAKNSKVMTVDGVKIGIIGYITTTTPVISHPGPDLKFLDEIQLVQKEAKRLKEQERTTEIARLLSSASVTTTSLANAKSLLNLTSSEEAM